MNISPSTTKKAPKNKSTNYGSTKKKRKEKKRKTKHPETENLNSMENKRILENATPTKLNSTFNMESNINMDQLVMGNPNTTYTLLQHLKKMMGEKKKLEEEKENLKTTLKNRKNNQIRKSKKATTQFDFICKRIARIKIFPLVKFINSQKQLEDFEEIGSIGYQFLSELKHEDQIHKSLLVDGNEKEIWENAKQLVHEAIGEKRNATQTRVKKAWKAMYSMSERNDKIKSWFVMEKVINILLHEETSENGINTSSTNIPETEEYKMFEVFLDYFGTSIAGCSNFKKIERKNKVFQKTCTPSDEAFGIFTLERCWDTWLKEVVTQTRDAPRSSPYTIKNSNKKYAGWTKLGMKRYTDIANAVMFARECDQRRYMEEQYRLSYEKKHYESVGTQFSSTENNNNLHQEYEGITANANEDNFIPYNDLPGHQTNMKRKMVDENSSNEKSDTESDTSEDSDDDSGESEHEENEDEEHDTINQGGQNEIAHMLFQTPENDKTVMLKNRTYVSNASPDDHAALLKDVMLTLGGTGIGQQEEV